jgi:fatty-acyl-CoA synthase
VTHGAPTLPDLLAGLAASDPDAVAAVFGTQRLTFQQLDERSSRVAAALHAEGVGAGDPVAVWLPNCSEWIELQFGLAKLGALLVCVNTRYRSHELGGILARSRARWLVVQPSFRGIDFLSILSGLRPEQARGLSVVVLRGEERPTQAVPGDRTFSYKAIVGFEQQLPPDAMCASPERACVAFTSSGSTGAPKLIVHSQRGISEHARAVAASFFDWDDAVALITLPLCGVFGHATFTGALAAGRPSVVMDSFDAEKAVGLIEQHKVTTVTGPDEVMLRLLEAAAPPARIASWREGGFGAQAVDSELLIAQGDKVGVSLFQCYGSSECLGLTSRQPRGASPAERALGGGVPVSPATEVRVRSTDSDATEPPGTPGILEIRGPSVMLAYLNDPDATEAAFAADGWFRTGDIGYLVDAVNRFVFLTRNNDALRLAGFLVEPREIEHFIERLESVHAAQAVEVRTPKGARVVAFVIPVDGEEVREEEVVAHCAASLAKYKVPVRVFSVESFPTTPSANGDKVQRGRLRELAHELVGPAGTAGP